MNPVSFLIALAALSAGTYIMRLAGVKVGAALALKGQRRAAAAASTTNTASTTGTASAPTAVSAPTVAEAGEEAAEETPTSRATKWMDRATVVLIGAVFATTAIFDGQDIADPARLIGVGAGVLAAVARVPMLICVVLAMGVCALIRMTGVL